MKLSQPWNFSGCDNSYYIINETDFSVATSFTFLFVLLIFCVIDSVQMSVCAVVFILVHQCLKTGSDGLFEHSQLVGGTWEWAYPTLCLSCGYFAYDQLDMLLYRLYSGLIPSILMHHLILLICFTLALYRNVTINYLILTLICEVCFLKSFSILFFL